MDADSPPPQKITDLGELARQRVIARAMARTVKDVPQADVWPPLPMTRDEWRWEPEEAMRRDVLATHRAADVLAPWSTTPAARGLKWLFRIAAAIAVGYAIYRFH